jgi:hypothetical protein
MLLSLDPGTLTRRAAMTTPPPMALEEYREAVRMQHDHREEYRREIERHVQPLLEAARETDKGAVELGQSILRTSTLLNGGALVAIPAVVALFGVDATAIVGPLLIAGGLFAGGLMFSWVSGFAGFFALSNRADRDYASGELTKNNTYLSYYPPQDESQSAQIKSEISTRTDQVTHHHRWFVRTRFAAIVFSFLSLAAFIGGNILGGWAIIHAPFKPATSAQSAR